MFCEHCGKENVNDALFCEECGQKMTVVNEESNISSNNSNVNASTIYGAPLNIKNPLKKMTKKQKIFSIAILVAVISLLLIFKIISTQFTPEKVAKNFFEGLVNQNYKKAMSYLNLPEDELLTVNNFESVIKESGNFENILNYYIDEGEPSLVKKDDNLKNAITKNISIKYIIQSSQEEKKIDLHLIKIGKNKTLFFNQWKIAPNNLLDSDWEITIPKDAKLYINDQEVNKNKIKETQKSNALSSYYSYFPESNLQQVDVYNIENVFKGKYKLKVSLNDEHLYENTVNSYGSFNLSKMDMNKEALSEFNNILNEIFKYYYELYSKDNTNAEKMKALLFTESDALEEITEKIEYNSSSEDDSAAIYSLTEVNLNGGTVYDSTHISLNGLAKYKYVYTDSQREYTSSNSFSIYMIKENGKWKATYCSLF